MTKNETVNEETDEVIAFDPTKISIARRVTFPVLKQRVGNAIYVKFLEPMEQSDTRVRETKDDRDPATIAKVYDCVGGHQAIIIVTAVTKSNLEENYPNNGYVGKFFKIELFAVEGKKYHQVELVEFAEPKGFVMNP